MAGWHGELPIVLLAVRPGIREQLRFPGLAPMETQVYVFRL